MTLEASFRAVSVEVEQARAQTTGSSLGFMTDTFQSGVVSVIPVLRPKGDGWREVPANHQASLGYPLRAFIHDASGLAVLSAVEVMADENKGPEYHVSISKQDGPRAARCDSNEAKWVLAQFRLDGTEEDNHVHSGVVRNFWRTVAEPLIGLECECKADEPTIREDKGDFVWRPISK